MARKTVLKTGRLTDKEKVYIAENHVSKTVDNIAKYLKRQVTVIQNYINKITVQNQESNTEVNQPEKTNRNYSHNEHGASVLTEEGAAAPYRTKKYESPFKTR